MTAEDTLAHHADTAREAVRAINHLTVFGPVVPAPDLYPVLGSLTLLGHGLGQAVGQLATGLARSAEVYELTESDPTRSPAVSIAEAGQWLGMASEYARLLGTTLDHAHAAIAGQGWTDTRTDHDTNGDPR